MNFNTIIDNQILNLDISAYLNQFNVQINNNLQKIDCVPLSNNAYSLILNGKTYLLTINPKIDEFEITVNHYTFNVQVRDEVSMLLEQFGIDNTTVKQAGEIYAQIPGMVGDIFVKEGESVERNNKLCILEAMKMENEIDSPMDGRITQIYIKSGAKVEKGDLLMKITK